MIEPAPGVRGSRQAKTDDRVASRDSRSFIPPAFMALSTRQSVGSATSRVISPSLSRLTTSTPDPASTVATRARAVVELPRLSRSIDRSSYTSPMDRAVPPEVEPQEVLGEYEEGDTLYYFAKHLDGISYKVRTSPLVVRDSF
jgi:hypothetical protein